MSNLIGYDHYLCDGYDPEGDEPDEPEHWLDRYIEAERAYYGEENYEALQRAMRAAAELADNVSAEEMDQIEREGG